MFRLGQKVKVKDDLDSCFAGELGIVTREDTDEMPGVGVDFGDGNGAHWFKNGELEEADNG